VSADTQRVRIVFDVDATYRTNLKILSAKLNKPINQIIFDALQKTYGLAPPGQTNTPKEAGSS